jgi:hypothetical protein
MKDLFHQDAVEMIERETRKYELWQIDSPDHPDFAAAYDLLWEAFGTHGEIERREVIEEALRRDPYQSTPSGTFIRYFMLVSKGKDGEIRGVRDGAILLNASYSADLCVIYLSHIYMVPSARGTVLSYWLRIAPVELAMQFMADLYAQGKFILPLPNSPAKNFGMRIDLAAEMEYFTPEERLSLQRILFYGRGGFDVINPRHFPYRQPDFRDAEEIRKTGNLPVPFMLLLRRMGRERQATLPITEAQAVMRLLYDDFAQSCAPEYLGNSLQLVLNRLEERAKTKGFVELLPLPSGAKDLLRLRRIFRYTVYQKYYPNSPETVAYLSSGIKEKLAQNPKYLEEELAKIAVELDDKPHYVYGNRDKSFTWEGQVIPQENDGPDADHTTRVMLPPELRQEGAEEQTIPPYASIQTPSLPQEEDVTEITQELPVIKLDETQSE